MRVTSRARSDEKRPPPPALISSGGTETLATTSRILEPGRGTATTEIRCSSGTRGGSALGIAGALADALDIGFASSVGVERH